MIGKFLINLRYMRWYYWGRYSIKRNIKKASHFGKIKVVIGSADTHNEGWISTDLPHFDITKKSDWHFFFKKTKVNNLFAEHVLEHLTINEVEIVAKLSFEFLSPNGCFRIAVPDAWHPNPEYIKRESDKSNFYLPPNNHKSFWNIERLTELLISTGYEVEPHEYCNKEKTIITSNFSSVNGLVKRSKSNGFLCEIKNYSSLIIDAKKTLKNPQTTNNQYF